MTSSVADLLLSRRFGPLFATQFLGAFNDNLLKSALGVLAAYRLAQTSGIDAGALAMLAGALFIAPFVLFSGAAGTLADRIDKSRIARAVKLAEIVIMLFGGAALMMENLPALLAALFLLGLHSTVFGPVKYALLPQHLADADLVAGNALVDAGTFLAILLGTLLGSALILAPGGATWVGAVGVGAAIGGWIAARALPPAAPSDPAAVPRPRLLADGVAVIRHVADDGALRGPILALSWFWALGGTVVSGLPVLARDTLGADESAVTLMLAIFALGVGAGSMLANRVLGGTVTARPVPWAGLAMAACALVVAAGAGQAPASPAPLAEALARPSAWRFLGGLGGLAIAGGFFAVPLYAVLLRRSDATHRARVIAANNIANALAMIAVSLGAALLLGSGWSMPGVVGLCGLVTVVVAGACTRLTPGPHAH
jgi:MFS family permease